MSAVKQAADMTMKCCTTNTKCSTCHARIGGAGWKRIETSVAVWISRAKIVLSLNHHLYCTVRDPKR